MQGDSSTKRCKKLEKAVMTAQNYSEWMTIALEEAHKSLPQDVPVGCVILQIDGSKQKLISKGHNTREKNASPTGHAEITALEQAAKALGRWRLDDCIAVVTLEPCPMCAAALLQSRIGTLIFGASSPQEGALGSQCNLVPLYANKTVLLGGILEQDCKKLLSQTFQQQRIQ